MRKFTKVLCSVSLTFSLFAVVGCGGGGGSSSGGGGGDDALSMTQANAQTAAASVIASDYMTMGLAYLAPMMPEEVLFRGASSPVARALRDVAARTAARSSALVPYIDDTFPGCTGTQVVSAQVDQLEGATYMTGTVTYSNYDDSWECDGEKLSGTVAFTVNKSLTETASTLTFTNFNSVGGSVTARVTGTLVDRQALDWSSGSSTANLTVSKIVGGVVTDTLKMTNYYNSYVMAENDYTATLDYDGSLAYNGKSFTIDTITPVVFLDTDLDDYPSQGVLLLTGGGKARVTFTNSTDVKVEADPAGSGAWTTAYTGTWDNLLTTAGFN